MSGLLAARIIAERLTEHKRHLGRMRQKAGHAADGPHPNPLYVSQHVVVG
jgi:hypothetical protein